MQSNDIPSKFVYHDFVKPKLLFVKINFRLDNRLELITNTLPRPTPKTHFSCVKTI